MTQGKPAGKYGPASGPLDAPPDDTGEALDLPPGGLTLTFGFGPTLFRPQTGTTASASPRVAPRPSSTCRTSPATRCRTRSAAATSACRRAATTRRSPCTPSATCRASRSAAPSIRWSQLGFGRTSSTSRGQTTPRNLFGFKDGTANIKSEDTVRRRRPGLGRRRRRRRLDGGRLLPRRPQDPDGHRDLGPPAARRAGAHHRPRQGRGRSALGRHRVHRAELPRRWPRTAAPRSTRTRTCGSRTPTTNGGAQLLRRGYNFVDGNDELGRLNAGLFFIAFQRDPRTQFIPIQQRLARERRDERVRPARRIGVFAVPPGAKQGSFVGAGLFD